MTFEGVLLIIVVALVLIKFFQSQLYLTIFREKPRLSLKSLIETAVFTLGTILAGMYITDLIIALVLFNAIVWGAFHALLKYLKYSLLAWISAVLCWLFVHATYTNFTPVAHTELWYYTLISWSLAFMFILIYDTTGKYLKLVPSLLTWVVIITTALIASIFIAYQTTYSVPLKSGPLYAIYQTNLQEAIEYIAMYGYLGYLFLVGAILVALLVLLIRLEFQKRKAIDNGMFFKIVIGLFLAINLNVFKHLEIPTLLTSSINDYQKEVEIFKAEMANRKSGEIDFTASKNDDKELYVIVIGESLNKNHMSLYGYHRNTTPSLDSLYKDNAIIKYDQAVSSHTHTVQVLTQSLTETNQINKNDFYTSLSALEVLNVAGFETYWLTNQLAYGAWDNPISALAEAADHRYNFNLNIGMVADAMVLDNELVVKLKEIIKNGINKNTVVFLHLMGNHGSYEKRYSSDYEKFSGPLERHMFGPEPYKKKAVNAYDNSVLYNDFVVSEAIKAVKEYDKTSALLYFSDHSEDVLQNKGHNADVFTWSMVQIPMLGWFSDGYKNTYKEKYEAFINNRQKLFTNDLLYDGLIGMTGVASDRYTSKHDVFSPDYRLPIDQCFTLHGHLPYNKEDNYYYYQHKNTRFLDSLGQLSRVYPHRVNTIGKLNNILYNGHNSFEIDIIFRQNNDSTYFEIGHDDNSLSGISLKYFLEHCNVDNLKKIWLDLKNLNSDNLQAVVKQLNLLDEQFNIKSKAIVESSIGSEDFSLLADEGFHTSFYLPTHVMDYDKPAMIKEAKMIANQVHKQNVSAVSFDAGLFPFVKEHLEPLLQNHIVYHTWDLPRNFTMPDLPEILFDEAYYHDERVKSILIKYYSDFEL
ncbi:phosphoethanolamine transferase [Cytophagaceae bacterium ABcell3]|nr:phosphoethanolamine transferase [Cytophagaceae bacterium ABcell3]